jgi:hypothetical protein
VTYNRSAFYAFWGLANGPFAFSVLSLKNALVLHDLPNLASTFIHLTPVSLSWCFRWYANDVKKQFPGIFDLPDPKEAATESLWDIWYPAMAFYFMWWVFYTFGFMFFAGRWLGSPWHQYDTLFCNTMVKSKQAAKICGWDPSTPESRARMIPIIIYMLGHALLVVAVVAASYLLWFNFWVHSIFAALLFASCTFHGANRYFKMMTSYYERGLQKIINQYGKDDNGQGKEPELKRSQS